MKLITARCWCDSNDIEIPVGWIYDGKTDSCTRPGCSPGCVMVPNDCADEPEPDTPGELRIEVGERLCGCGCGETVKSKSNFKIGHDAKLKAVLSRAYAEHLTVVLVDGDTAVMERVDPIEYAARFSGKTDWTALIRSSAARLNGQTPDELEQGERRAVA